MNVNLSFQIIIKQIVQGRGVDVQDLGECVEIPVTLSAESYRKLTEELMDVHLPHEFSNRRMHTYEIVLRNVLH